MVSNRARGGVRMLALAALSLMVVPGCELGNDEGGPGPGPGSPGSVLPGAFLGAGIHRASLKGVQAQPNGGSYEPRTSGNGRFVAFSSYANNLVSGDTFGFTDVFVRDRQVSGTGPYDQPGNTGTIRVSVADVTGDEANSECYYPAISADGTHVAFISYASNLIANDTNFSYDVFVRDIGAGTTERVTVLDDESEIVGGYYYDYPTISGDGSRVAYSTYAPIDPQDTNNNYNVYVRDTVAGTTTWVDLPDGPFDPANLPNGPTYQAWISSDGNHVLFQSYASNLIGPGVDTNGTYDLFVRDLVNNTTRRVSVPDPSTGFTQANNSSSFYGRPISSDGRFVAFYSFASNLVVGDVQSFYDVFLHDRDVDGPGGLPMDDPANVTTQRVSVDSNEVPANNHCYYNTLSDDGRYVGFLSPASNLVAPDTNGTYDLFLRDMLFGTTTRVSTSVTGAQASTYCWNPDMSADGRTIAFYTPSPNLIPVDTNGQDDCFVRERDPDNNGLLDETTSPAVQTTTVRVSEVGSTEPSSNSFAPSISGDGKLVAFESDGDDVVAGDKDFKRDVFARDITTSANACSSLTLNGAFSAAGGGSLNASLSADGRVVAFESDASDLIGIADTNGQRDVYVRTISGIFRVSVADNEAQATGGLSRNASVSGDGRIVAFETNSENMDGVGAGGEDPDATLDVFARDLIANTTVLVSRASGLGGVKGNAASINPAVSADGVHVVFQSQATNLDGASTAGRMHIYSRNLVTGETRRLSLGMAGEADSHSNNPSVSKDGRFVAFESLSTNLVAGDGNGFNDIFVIDRDPDQNGTYDEPGFVVTTRVNVNTAGTEASGGPGNSFNPSISADGRYVAFASDATNLFDGNSDLVFTDDDNFLTDVFRHDTATGTTMLVSSNTSGGVSDGSSTVPSISADGSFVAFQSTATDLIFPAGATFTNVYRAGPLP